ncbi:hypothetical protein BBW68_07925 [Candidatus Erwinia dacicola]|uniref:Uncharacterized protein n=1 Tax=Candidatus Erwinia dacicola TaxID=252393 RepID=A0A1E7Z2E3_9GAMM|nr:hypothetical protein BBW68_07925 [Candidatus Erwinia dacicola]
MRLEWEWGVALNAGVNGIYLSRTNLDAAFDDNGQQVKPLMARLTGNVAGVEKLFDRCGWKAESYSDTSPMLFKLLTAGISGFDNNHTGGDSSG